MAVLGGRNSWVASGIEGSPPGPLFGSPSQGMPSIHSTFEELRLQEQQLDTVCAHGKVSVDGRQAQQLVPPGQGRSPSWSQSSVEDRAQGGSEKTFTVSVLPLIWLVAPMCRCKRRVHHTISVLADICVHGNSDQWEHSGPVEPIQPVSETNGHT